MMTISFQDFELDGSIVAPIIYRDWPHSTTSKGVVISEEVSHELRRFLSAFNRSVGVQQDPYYRIDAYFDESTLWILEINALFVDGWGTALNLSRASGIEVDPAKLAFPRWFASRSSAYLAELSLFVSELAHLGLCGYRILEWGDNFVDPTYVYASQLEVLTYYKSLNHLGETQRLSPLVPYDGLRLDNKLNLGLFSREWPGEIVKVPRHYIARFDQWEEIPLEVVLKLCDKSSPESARAHESVMFNKPSGKAPFIKRCYRDEALIAQDYVAPTRIDNKNCQLIIFVIGDDPITGYVQYSRSKIINDNSTHGPLRIG